MTIGEIGNWIFAYNDLVAYGPDSPHYQTSSATESGYSTDSGVDDIPLTAWKSSVVSGNVEYEIDLGASYSLKALGLFNHNASTAGASNVVIFGGATSPAGTTVATWAIGDIGNDDFFQSFLAGTTSYRYWRLRFQAVSAKPYFGRLFLAKSAFELACPPLLGVPKGTEKTVESIAGTSSTFLKSRGLTRKRIGDFGLLLASVTDRENIQDLRDYVLVENSFFMADPIGSNYQSGNAKGRSVHCRMGADALETMLAYDERTSFMLAGREVNSGT